MGCCLSRSTGPNSPYPGGAAPSASARAINPTAPRLSSPSAAGPGAGSSVASPTSPRPPHDQQQQQQRRRHRHSQQPLSQHINKPLRRHRWTARDRVWTRQALARERADFFDTRVTGRVEIWQAVRAALEVLWETAPPPTPAATPSAASTVGATTQQPHHSPPLPPARTTLIGPVAGANTISGTGGGHRHDRPAVSPIQPNQDQDEGLATAQSILTAAEITLPSGDLAQGVYDALGNYYPLPEWIVSDPLNAVDAADLPPAPDQEEEEEEGEGGDLEDVDDDDDDVLMGDAKRGVYVASSPGGEDADGDGEHGRVLSRRRGEKGKGVAHAVREETISVRCRLSENARDVVVTIGKSESVRSLSRKIVEDARLPSSARVRIAYLGRILREPASLVSQGWKEGHVVNALVFDAR